MHALLPLGISVISLIVGLLGIYNAYFCQATKRLWDQEQVQAYRAGKSWEESEKEKWGRVEQDLVAEGFERQKQEREAFRQRARWPPVRFAGDSCKQWEQHPQLCGVATSVQSYADIGSGVCSGPSGILKYCRRSNLNHDDCEAMCDSMNGSLIIANTINSMIHWQMQDRINGTVETWPKCVAYNPNTHRGTEGFVNGWCFIHFSGRWPHDDDDRWTCRDGDPSGVVTGHDGAEGGTCFQKVQTAEYYGIRPMTKVANEPLHDHAVSITADGSLRCGSTALESVPKYKEQPATIKNHSYASYGILLMFTADSLLTGTHVLANILRLTTLRPSLIYATVDVRNKSVGSGEFWAATHLFELQELARRLRATAHRYHIESGVIPTVLVEALHASSCMFSHLSEAAFNCSDYKRVTHLCDQDYMFMNSVAYTWGIARMAGYVARVAHLDDDMCLIARRLPHWQPARGDFLRVINDILDHNQNLMSVMIEEGPCWVNKENKCQCDDGFLRPFGSVNNPMGVMPLHGSCEDDTCYCGLLLGGFQPNSIAFSCQSFVLNPAVFVRDWPFKIRHEAHVEELFTATYGMNAISAWLPTAVLDVGRLRYQEARRQAVEGTYYDECFHTPIPDVPQD